jgi:hypothetical protein
MLLLSGVSTLSSVLPRRSYPSGATIVDGSKRSDPLKSPGPAGPCGPTSPSSPLSPFSPFSPGQPCGPAGPSGPGGPEDGNNSLDIVPRRPKSGPSVAMPMTAGAISEVNGLSTIPAMHVLFWPDGGVWLGSYGFPIRISFVSTPHQPGPGTL